MYIRILITLTEACNIMIDCTRGKTKSKI